MLRAACRPPSSFREPPVRPAPRSKRHITLAWCRTPYQTITTLLRRASGDEMETVMNYQTSAVVPDGVRANETTRSLRTNIRGS